MIAYVNGEAQVLPAGSTVESVVGALDAAPRGRGVAVAVDGEVVPRTRWAATAVPDGARIEIVVAVQGG